MTDHLCCPRGHSSLTWRPAAGHYYCERCLEAYESDAIIDLREGRGRPVPPDDSE